MSRTCLLVATALLFAAAPGLAGEAAKADLDILRDTIRANKKAFVAANLNLTDDEAKQFWPVYDRYQAELKGVNDRLLKTVEDYTAGFRDLSDEKAKQLVDDYLTEETDRAKVRRSYADEIGKALPGRKVARFYQIENKMDAVMRYDLAAEIPVIDEAPAKQP
jgi:hypothetical protein